MGKFVRADGSVPYGHFQQEIGEINFEEFALRDPFRRKLPASEKERRFVHFHFMGFTSDRFIAGCSLSYTSVQKTVFFYLFDRETGKMIKNGCRIGQNDLCEISLNPDNGTSQISGNGMDVAFKIIPEINTRSLEVIIENGPTLSFDIQNKSAQPNTLRVCTPTGPNGWTYCQKIAGAEPTGTLQMDGVSYNLSSLNASAHYDFTAGFLRQDTFWNWACITGFDEGGNHIGLNLSNGVNETGHSENVLWINGEMIPLGQAEFSYNLDNLKENWKISTNDNRVNLNFACEGLYTAYATEGSAPCDFSQLFGIFSGEISLPNNKITLTAIPGFCERQYALWWS
ncbi:DUF2804 family protein [Sneathiella sp. P13V-1]|uniref:DUF2804 domain-containing protein n=1 Tax=Sneathiella sp. P13V-1 TaxID=2697366 RepID=UPI00187B1DF1|nr:DUF2804 domain-containing protein [Sneathiella sp. P13V-1]MBE7635324.1 DUF2804 family protein [Sneathiella sp. P13V-1]